jgi:hypothetical protein
VDTTQRREGYASEVELNALRREYIERARGLGLMVIFNTTVHEGNFSELPELVHFFRDNADVIGMVSFNLQAETGRGEWGSRHDVIDQTSVRAQIEAGAGRYCPGTSCRLDTVNATAICRLLFLTDTYIPQLVTKIYLVTFCAISSR